MDDFQRNEMVDEIPSNPRNRKPRPPQKEPPVWFYIIGGIAVLFFMLKFG